ncbi:hypothetical protein EIP91_003401 [Steccherinum ochraceum]|uniref:NADP-dependent oxidoreductase domain-containing protein n=1 Tax=Steccherinum ochraceum TaxID=92696 RepID=A0A4R0RE02_9APHY|nr:hypothetical protein EIP91_003401 [Steccherinum ochraceum]
MSITQKSTLNIVFGAMTFGKAGNENVRVSDLKTASAILDVFQKHGHTEVDSARSYGGGTSETVLGELEWQKRGLKMETKLYANAGGALPTLHAAASPLTVSHSPEDLRKHLDISLRELRTDCLDMWYLHVPDRTTPYEVTFKAVDELYKEGKLKRLGISNFMAWEVAEIVTLCRANGWIQPTVYQGIYNAMHRLVEPELFPCLRKFGISFYAYNPLGGGFFTGRYNSSGPEEGPAIEEGSRFDPTRKQGQYYRWRYWNDRYFKALEIVQRACDKHGLKMAEVALRWISHHSFLKREHGDAVIIGASSVKHIEENLKDLEKGPLPEEVVQALEEAHEAVKGHETRYWFEPMTSTLN